MANSELLLSVLKFLHIWAVIMAVGNSALGPYRRRQARLSGNAHVIAGTYAIQSRSGQAVTIPWFAVVFITGLTLTWLAGTSILRTGWVFWALVLTIAAATLFVAGVAPHQRAAAAAAAVFAEHGLREDFDRFQQHANTIEPMSHTAHAVLVSIVALMVVKPDLPLPW